MAYLALLFWRVTKRFANLVLVLILILIKFANSVGGTTFPNTDKDESAILENEERRTSPTTSSDETISVKTDKRYTLWLGVKRSDQARDKDIVTIACICFTMNNISIVCNFDVKL